MTFSVRKMVVALVCLNILCLQLSTQSPYGSIVGAVTGIAGAAALEGSLPITGSVASCSAPRAQKVSCDS